MKHEFDIARFESDISQHQMQVIRDDDVSRHIRFKRPGTTCMYFDLVTWRGHLCYTGDMGTYVFQRLDDMFEFFRRQRYREAYAIDFRYWAEKVQAADKIDGVTEWSPDAFRAAVREHVEAFMTDRDDGADVPDDLWTEIEDRVLSLANDQHYALAALHEFEHEGFEFRDWEQDCMTWSYRFLWCCHALEWAIGVYDRARDQQLLDAALSCLASPSSAIVVSGRMS